MTYKPDGYPSVSPYLLVRDAARTLEFVKEVFGAQQLRVIEKTDTAGIMHAEARIDDSVIMMGEVADAADTHVHVYVPDVEATFAKAKAMGDRVVQELERQGDGDRRGGVHDGNGVVWWISRQE